ncbi:MAG: beta-lactamase family protein [Melioribacteraceae bacterium]|nr:beta-lactamase family protein [Melioribacteraceae bacterium]
MNKPVPLLLLLLILNACSSNVLESNMTPKERANLVLGNMIKNSETPGVQYSIFNSDSTIFDFCSGYSILENKVSLKPENTINAFSVTKTFTALAILQLAEKGLLGLDDNVQIYLDDLPYKENFTIRQLLNHTAGIPNPLPISWIHLYEEHPDFNYDSFVKKVIHENCELDNIPGEKFAYSNVGYLILGEIIEKVSGVDYRTYIEKNIIGKLELDKDSDLSFNISDTTNHSGGYIKKWSFINFGLNFLMDKDKYMGDSYNGWNRFKYFYMNGYPFGGLIGNAKGFRKYLQSLLRENSTIIGESKKKLFEAQFTSNGEPLEMGLSWFKGKLGSETYFAHAGGGGGYYCEIRIYPDRKMGSVIIFNKTGVSDSRILDEVDKFFIEIISVD